MTNNEHSLPPFRDLPPGRLSVRKEHLLAEVARDEQRFVGWPKRTQPPHSRWVARPALIAALAVLAALLATAGLLVTRTGTGTASAAEVRGKVTQALGSAQNISGEFTVQTRPPDPVRHRQGCFNCYPAVPIPSRFVIGADGSYAQHSQGTQRTLRQNMNVRADVAYNARTGVQTSYQQGYVKGPGLYVTATHLDPAVPGYSPEAQLAAFVRQALVARNPHVENTSYDGRPAWKLTLRFTPGDDFYDSYGVRVDVVVDRATGLVLQVTQYADSPDRWTSIESIHNLKIGTSATPADFTLPVPAGAQVIAHDYGFRRVTVSEAAGIVGYRPLLPKDTGGRPLVDFAGAKVSKQSLDGFYAPAYHDVASARYGRGFGSFIVSTRRGRVTELPGLFEGLSARTVKLTRGPLAGEIVYLSTSPPNPGYLASFHNGLIVQVIASSAHDAMAIANSLAAAR